MTPWADLILIDAHSTRELPAGEPEARAALAEYRRRGCIAGWYLARTEEQEEAYLDPSEWGPSVEQIDWTGFAEVAP